MTWTGGEVFQQPAIAKYAHWHCAKSPILVVRNQRFGRSEGLPRFIGLRSRVIEVLSSPKKFLREALKIFHVPADNLNSGGLQTVWPESTTLEGLEPTEAVQGTSMSSSVSRI